MEEKRTVSGSSRSLPMRARFSKARLMEAKAVATGVRAVAPAEGMVCARMMPDCQCDGSPEHTQHGGKGSRTFSSLCMEQKHGMSERWWCAGGIVLNTEDFAGRTASRQAQAHKPRHLIHLPNHFSFSPYPQGTMRRLVASLACRRSSSSGGGSSSQSCGKLAASSSFPR